MKKMIQNTICLVLALWMALTLLPAAAWATPEEAPLTRGGLARMLVEMFELKYDESMATSFDDVPRDSPYYEAVSIMYSKGIVRGVSETIYDVDGVITRAVVATILFRAGLPEGTPETVPSDVPSNVWYYYGVCCVVHCGVMTVREDGKFYPNDPAYPSEINTSAFNALLDTTTEGTVQLDLMNGSITISKNLMGMTVFTQGETVIRTDGNSAILRQSTSTPTGNTVTVESGDVTLTIVDLNVESDTAPIRISNGAKLTLDLLGSSSLTASLASLYNGYLITGIQVLEGAELEIRGSGAVTATGYAEGIGGGGTVTIYGGTVTATGYGGAGIGGGNNGNYCTVTIYGGTVTATGARSSAGIGGSYVGIGDDRVSGGTITIYGGNVTATGGETGAGIGGGFEGSGGMVTIHGGTVTAVGGSTGIGGGSGGTGGTVTICGGSVTAKGRYTAIGGGKNENRYGCNSITIADEADVTVECNNSNNLSSFKPYTERIDFESLSDTAALAGSSALFSLTASGHSGLSYQWQESADNENWTDLDGQIAATAAIPMSAENDGYYYRCRLTNGWGNEVYTGARAYVLRFTQQPESVEGGIGSMAALSVTSSYANVSYQWQRSLDDGASWTEVSGEIYSTLLVTASLSENGALYRCIITASNGDSLASDGAYLAVSGGGTAYTTRFYLQRADGSGYDLADQLVTEASAGANVTAGVKTFEHFSENTAKGTHSGTVREDSSLVLSRYYDRVSYTIAYETGDGAALGTDSVKYGAALSLPTPSRIGCVFAGWYWDEGLTREFTETAMPGEDLTLYAGWSVVGEGRGVEYRINGITLRDSGYQSIGAIPRGTFYAEVSVTNLSSNSMDTLLLATYDRDGRMLGLSFLYANPGVGQTFVLGTSIDNSRGDVAQIKAFMLPMLGGLVPLAESAEFAP